MFKRWLLLGSFVLMTAACPMAQKAAHSKAPRKETTYNTYEGQVDHFFDWTNEKWTNTDRPFLLIEREVNALIARKQLTPAVVQKLHASALKQQASSKSQFRWIYAMMKVSGGVKLDFDALLEADAAMGKADSPRSARYARLRFFLAMWRRPNVKLIGVGQRLLARYPRDYGLKSLVVQIMGAGNPTEREKALAYARELVSSRPNDADAHFALAEVYSMRSDATHNPADADGAITAYRKYLQLAPANAPSREGVTKVIPIIERQKAKWAAGG